MKGPTIFQAKFANSKGEGSIQSSVEHLGPSKSSRVDNRNLLPSEANDIEKGVFVDLI